MHGAVGVRNAIIQDYLNLDWNKLEAVLKEQKEQNTGAYTKKYIEASNPVWLDESRKK